MPENVEAKIVEAAKKLFARLGYKKTALDDIAREAGFAKSSLYHYFSSKEDLFRAVVISEMGYLNRRVRRAIADESGPEKALRAYIFTRMNVLQELANTYVTLHEEYMEKLGFVEGFRQEAFQEEVSMVRSILEDGVEKGEFEMEDPPLTAYAVVLALKGLEYPWMVNVDAARLKKDLSILVNLLVRALRKG